MKAIFFILGLSLISCKNEVKSAGIGQYSNEERMQDRALVINFSDVPKDTFHFQNRLFKLSSVVNFSNTNGLKSELIFASEETPFKRSLNLETNILTHCFRKDDFYFEVKNGDSLNYYERNGYPYYEGSDALLNESNLYNDKRIKFLERVPPYDFYSFYIANKDKYKNNNDLRENYIHELNIIKNSETFLLDSLFAQKKITKFRYHLEKEKIKFNFYNYLPPKELKLIIEKDSIYADLSNQELIKYSFYTEFLQNYATHKFQIKTIRRSNDNVLDSKSKFDSIVKSTLFSKEIKSYLLYKNLVNIGTDFPQKDFQLYFNEYKKMFNDSLILLSLEKKFLINFTKSKQNVDEVLFVDKESKKRSLKQIVTENKGKLIYIDFWASWCGPCRSAMPSSKKLKKKYKDDDVVFIYVSIDKDSEKWEKASKEENLKFDQDNLLALNYPDAELYVKLNLNSIPRYILYNKNGELINDNAPDPSSQEIIQLIDKLLDD